MSPTPRLLAFVLFYNASEVAIRTVRSLRAQQGVALDVVVFDNASAPEARQRLQAAIPDVEIHTSARNLGYTGGNNAALQLAADRGYDYVLLCNQDIELEAFAVAHLVECAVARPSAGLIGGVEVAYASGDRRAAGARGFSRITGRLRWDTDEHVADPSGRVVDFVQGAMVMVAVDAVRRGLRFDERLFLYYDEVDLGLQVRHLGLQAVVDDRVLVRHDNAGNHLSPSCGYLHQRNRTYLVRKYGTPLTVVAHVVVVGGFELPIKTVVRGLQGHGRFAAACWHGFLDGLRSVMGDGHVARWRPAR